MPRKHTILRDGIVAGAIGAVTVAAWFLIIDLSEGRPLHTPAMLGAGLLSVLGPTGPVPFLAYAALYTVIHVAAFVLVGLLAALIVHQGERQPAVLAGALLLFVVLELGFHGIVAVLAESALGDLAWYQVAVGNLLAAISMGTYLLRTHPALGHQMDLALSGEDDPPAPRVRPADRVAAGSPDGRGPHR